MALRVGFIGLGEMGGPMARWLVEKSLETAVYDLRPEAVEELRKAGARAAGSCRELAGQSEVIGVCVRDDADVRAAVLAPDGVLAGAASGAIVALHSTIRPSTVFEVARAASERGVGVVDAPITGGAAGARNGTLCYMVGGEAELVERCRPVFETSASRIVHTGALGTGAATKLSNNLMTYRGFLAAFEATLLADGAGLSREALFEVTRANGNLTDPMRAYLGLHDAAAERGGDERFQAMVRGYTELAEKDLAVTLDFARERGVALPGAALCQQLMARVYGLQDEKRR